VGKKETYWKRERARHENLTKASTQLKEKQIERASDSKVRENFGNVGSKFTDR